MARLTVAPAPVADDRDDPQLKAMLQKLARADIDRNHHRARISDCYKFALPWRHQFNSDKPGTDQIDEVFDELPANVLEDFAADMLNTFTPQKNNWLKEQVPQRYGADDRRRLEKPLAERQNIVFGEMSRSNLYQAMQEAYLDLGPGTMCLLITDMDAAKPIHCEAIPVTDLKITRGPFGFIDGIFRCRKYLRDEIPVLWPGADMSRLGQRMPNGDQTYDITDGCWRDWNDRGTERYIYLVTCESHIIYRREWTGPGSCPFVVARWSRDPTTAWGFGPTYRVLPAIKTRNHVRYLALKNYDKHVDPVTSYEDDGVMNIDNGVQPGDWVPRAVGSDAPQALESQAKFDVQIFEMDQLASIIKAAHYQDRPEQLGKTPPTATQWADEAAERARRMGTPATNLVHEWQIPIYRRFVYLLEQRGVLPNIKLDGEEIPLEPVSPLLRAQEQERVVRNDKFAELMVARFGPQLGAVIIDVVAYAKEQGNYLGINPDLIRDEGKLTQAIEQLMPVLQSTGYLPTSTPDVGVAAGLPQ